MTSNWQPMNTAPRDGTKVLLRTWQGVVDAYFKQTSVYVGEHLRSYWVCYAGEFLLFCEETCLNDGTITYDAPDALGWMPIPP